MVSPPSLTIDEHPATARSPRLAAPRPQSVLLVLVALAPFNGLLLLVAHPGFLDGWKEGLLLAAVGLAVVGRGSRPPGRPLAVWTPAAIGYLALSAVSAASRPSVAALVGLKITGLYALAAAVLWAHPFDARDRDRLVGIFQVTGIVTALVGLGQQLAGANALAALGFEYNETIRTAGGMLRSFSTFDQPFPFALHVMTAILVGLPAALAEPQRRRHRVFLAAMPLLVAGLASAIVRAALVGLMVGGLYLVVRRHRALAHAAVPLLVALLVVPSGLAAVFASSSSLGQRATGWGEVASKVVEAPFGIGIGTTGAAAEKVSGRAKVGSLGGLDPTEQSYQPDNAYIRVVLELGVIGLWLFVRFLAGAITASRRVERARAGPDRALALGITATLLASVVAALFATYWEIFPMDLELWILLGALGSIDGAPARVQAEEPGA